MHFTIRDLAGIADMRECEEVQREVWGFIDLDVVPAGLMSVMSFYGAIAAGAFVGDRMAGFVSGFPGYVHEGYDPPTGPGGGSYGRSPATPGDSGALAGALHHSHMLAVRREFRGWGIGIALKWAQADRVRALGVRRINWTFDPHQAKNANMNLNRPGCVASGYRLNVYGKRLSPLHGGLPTDRLDRGW